MSQGKRMTPDVEPVVAAAEAPQADERQEEFLGESPKNLGGRPATPDSEEKVADIEGRRRRGDRVPNPAGPDREALETRIAAINSEIARKRDEALWWEGFVAIAGLGTAGCVYLFVTAAPDEVWRRPLTGIGALVALLVVVGCAHFLRDIWREIHSLRDNRERLEFESEMMAYEASVAQRRAEKLLRINEQLLRRYYNLNLSQGLWVFVTGIACVVVGIAVVVWTFYAVAQVSGQTEAQIVIGAVGAVGAILSNYVAAVYLRIHASAAESLRAFHARLVSTHELFLANLLSSNLSEARREDVLGTLVLEIAKRRTDEPKS